ncbi:TIGR03943 family putative permease subunit [Neobacillus massiliamazoniensis]|uniref:EmrB/QacA family drug resistance transporter n=1 Tax=Neobacillus massiliamazoniensis TaxID=1499688 RepID=A0A0U1P027_9BACI|nr:TIGR03943 family protein [Neobacillus massiliamazoniensis]CRK83597.1 EmrB/QacA family drug resistance transporter [Neobacillus massiliamazoniensis]
MIRSIILIGFTYLLFKLHLTGDISKYINMKYSYLSAAAGYALAVLTIVQICMLAKDDPKEAACDHDHCGHNHSKEDKWYKKLVVYPIFLFPIVSGLFFPIATLDSNIVKSKGFHFPIYDTKDPYFQQEFLRPDTSIYYGKDDYEAFINKSKKKYINQNSITLNDKDFLDGMETIYNFPGEFDGRELEFKGFVFHDPDNPDKNQLLILRFGVIHCIADAGVFGMLVDMPSGVNLKNDEWITVKGKISTMYYQPFKTTIPYVQVDKWSKTSAPADQYVYRSY